MVPFLRTMISVGETIRVKFTICIVSSIGGVKIGMESAGDAE
jgi:hypothetical protein